MSTEKNMAERGVKEMLRVGRTTNLKLAENQIVQILAINGVLISEVDGLFRNVKMVIKSSPVGGKFIPKDDKQQKCLLNLLQESFLGNFE